MPVFHRSMLSRFRTQLRERLGPLRHLPALFWLVWSVSPALTAASLVLRLVRALLPLASLYVAKLILDAIVAAHAADRPSASLADWLADDRLTHIALLVVVEFGLGIASDLLGRATSLVDSVLAERSGNAITLTLMSHAASLDLQQFEDSAIQDKLERARRQVAWRSNLISQIFGQGQDLVTVLSLAAGVITVLPWLIVLLVLALIPSFLNEMHFNRSGYRLAYARSPERRETDYLRYLGAGAESAKEIKLFGLNDHLSRAFPDALAERMFGREYASLAAAAGQPGRRRLREPRHARLLRGLPP